MLCVNIAKWRGGGPKSDDCLLFDICVILFINLADRSFTSARLVPSPIQIDHIKPQIKEGTDHIENLQLLCGSCNSIKGDRPQEYLIQRLEEQERELKEKFRGYET